MLPEVDSYEPTDDGESPLSKMTDWVNTTCPSAAAPPSARPTPCRSGPAPAGTSCGIWIPTTTRRSLPGSAGLLVSRGLVQRRHGAHHAPPALLPFLAQVPV
ncbi:MAG: hypothetical protein ACLSHG_02055 [Oscillospiraceae bacterium]